MALKGLTITLSAGLHPQRSVLSSHIQQNGGRYSPELSKSCTHLVANSSGGSMFVVAKKWGVSVVNERWLSDCFKHKKKMDEKSYQHAAVPHRRPTPPTPPKTSPPLQNPSGKRATFSPPRHTTRHEIDVSPKKKEYFGHRPMIQPDETLLFRGCCFVLVGFDREDIEAVAETVERRGGRVMEWRSRDSHQKGLPMVRSYASTFLCPKSESGSPSPQPSVPLSNVSRKGNEPPSSLPPSSSRPPSSCAIYVVSKHGKPAPEQVPTNIPVVTPQWIERCCVVGHILAVKSNPMFEILPHRVPFSTMKGSVFSAEGFSKQGRSLMKNMVVIMGGRFSKFSHETDFLICSSSALQEAGRRGLKEGGKESKLFQARELGIPVVNEEWLCSCARAGCLLSPPEGLKELKRVEIEDDIGVVRATEEAEKEVFTGVLAFVPLSRFEQAELFCNLVMRLGGKVTLDPKACTHFIHEGPPKKTSEFLSAKHGGAEFVSPVWLYECLSQACYLPPPLFSPELKLGRSLGGVVTSSPTSGTKRKRKEENFAFSRKRERLDFRVKRELGGEKKIKKEERQKSPPKSAAKQEEELVLKEIVDILGMLQEGPGEEKNDKGIKTEDEGIKMEVDEVTKAQLDTDPVPPVKKEIRGDEEEGCSEEGCSEEAKEIQEGGRDVPHFAFTGFERKDLEKCKKVVTTLGGKWESGVTKNTTHVVACRKLSRSEKTVAALAMGAWVVSEQFIHRAWEKKAFPDPALYQYDPQGSQLAKGAAFWKEKLRGSQKGAFTGVRGMFFMKGEESPRIKSFQKVLGLGRGKVMPFCEFESIDSSNLENLPTHLFLEGKPEKESVPDCWREHNVIVIPADSITNFLMNQGNWE